MVSCAIAGAPTINIMAALAMPARTPRLTNLMLMQTPQFGIIAAYRESKGCATQETLRFRLRRASFLLKKTNAARRRQRFCLFRRQSREELPPVF
jgi:hypothetical protein